jgi:SAM-dependent methyltransferase
MFQTFATELRRNKEGELVVLELGSGPGFLADFLLDALLTLELTLLDFSPAMHDLARTRLSGRINRVRFLDLSFKDLDWLEGLGPFDAVIANQAIHELRHKRYAQALYSQVASILKPGAPYLVCDHYFGESGFANDQLYMTIDEQKYALLGAGFRSVELVGRSGTLVMHHAA